MRPSASLPSGPRSSADEVEVLVVGAGPVGLTMACELRRHGAACRIIDAGGGPTPTHESRALGIQARTLEVFGDMGLVGPVLERGSRVRAVNAYDAGRRFARFELDFDGLGTPYPFVLILSQGETERRLIDALARHGGAVEWQVRLTDLRQDDHGVTATLADAGEREREVRASWLVGCDGAHSAVRHRLGLPFAGAAYEEEFRLADVRIGWDLDPDEVHLLLAPGGLVPALPLPEPGRWRLIDATGVVAAEDPGSIVARFRDFLRAAGFPAATVDEPAWASAFRIHRRAVNRLRVGRCFLAGDAAHIHSPVGGQGMNIGIQDASNLAWKLALVVAGAAPPAVLDSYEPERLPVAASILRGTDLATRIVTLRNPLARALRNRLTAWLSGLGPVRRRLTRELSELGIRYRGSPIAAEDWEGGPSGAGPRPGDRVPDIKLIPSRDGLGRLFDVLRGTHHTLLLFEGSGDRAAAGSGALEAVEDVAQRRGGGRLMVRRVVAPGVEAEADPGGTIPRIFDADGRLHRHFGARSACVYLIRPDGHVGYRGRPPAPHRFATYLERLFL